MKPLKSALPPPLIESMFAECGVTLRPGRAETISAVLGAAVARFRQVAHKLPFEREPGLFPDMDMPKKKRSR
ncbi:hypothetical protein [uncultured Ferrovibrio sp.]|jgi:hypothetical protein|uniref:hypothetical protein n=1 Tax=uncultured Ferrovibrio sp. TaxID=1576913 RepID=UPI00261334BA|nr:hypothetical protein [uncultured Ferrovibrio sp.]